MGRHIRKQRSPFRKRADPAGARGAGRGGRSCRAAVHLGLRLPVSDFMTFHGKRSAEQFRGAILKCN